MSGAAVGGRRSSGEGDGRRGGLGPYGLVLGAASCWGTIGTVYALILDGVAVSPVTVVFLRALSAFAFLLAALALGRRDLLRVRARDLPLLALVGIVCVGVFYPALIYAFALSGVAVATMLLYLAPAFVTVVSACAFGEPVGRRTALALGLCLVGAALVVEPWRGAVLRANAAGIALGLLSAVAYGSYSLLGKIALRRHGSPTLLLYMLGFGALALLPAQLVAGSAIPGGRALLLLCLVAGLIITLVPLGLYTTALRQLPGSTAAIIATVEPVVAIALAALVLRQFLRPAQLAGAALIVGGVIALASGARRGGGESPRP